MGKYEPLRDYLAACTGGEQLMTFSQIERLVGPLPDSAHQHRAWWGNDGYKSQSVAWQAAGWHVASVDQSQGQVLFARGLRAPTASRHQPTPSNASSYIDGKVIARIQAKEETDRFDWSKLLRLINELNISYRRRNVYAVHALLRAILDHVPPLLDCGNFAAVVSDYRWSRTDRAYMRKLMDFRLQADDVLHRQISGQPDLLSLDDVPPRAWINRLLLECAK
jgi:hypothetical protein